MWFRAAVAVGALAGAIVGIMPVFVLGLSFSELIVLPLSLGVAGLFAAVSAAWIGTVVFTGPVGHPSASDRGCDRSRRARHGRAHRCSAGDPAGRVALLPQRVSARLADRGHHRRGRPRNGPPSAPRRAALPDLARTSAVLLLGAVVVVGVLRLGLELSCGAEQKAVMRVFPHYGRVQLEPEPGGLGDCFASYTTPDPPERPRLLPRDVGRPRVDARRVPRSGPNGCRQRGKRLQLEVVAGGARCLLVRGRLRSRGGRDRGHLRLPARGALVGLPGRDRAAPGEAGRLPSDWSTRLSPWEPPTIVLAGRSLSDVATRPRRPATRRRSGRGRRCHRRR